MLASGRTGALRSTAGEVHEFALVAPVPVGLRGRSPGVEDHLVIAAAGVIVSAAGGADALRDVAAEVHAFALVAPAPVVLAGCGRPVIRDAVVAAAGAFVSAAGRTLAFGGVSIEEQALAFVAPAPVGLADGVVRDDAVELGAVAVRGGPIPKRAKALQIPCQAPSR